jgi:hypothetical protein
LNASPHPLRLQARVQDPTGGYPASRAEPVFSVVAASVLTGTPAGPPAPAPTSSSSSSPTGRPTSVELAPGQEGVFELAFRPAAKHRRPIYTDCGAAAAGFMRLLGVVPSFRPDNTPGTSRFVRAQH